MADENPYSSPSAMDEATSPSPHPPRYMSRLARAVVLLHLVSAIVYFPWAVVTLLRMEWGPVSPLALTGFVTVHLLVTALFVTAVVIVIRDLCLRDCCTSGEKLMWGLLFFLLWPSFYVYFFTHAWKPRSRESA